MKRFIFFCLTLLFSLSVTLSATAAVFSDVRDTDYCADAAKLLKELDVLNGYTDGSFKPNNPITRAEMAAVVCRMITKEEIALTMHGKTNFNDVDKNSWASGYINYAASVGIINGDGTGAFRPNDTVTYEEAIKMIVCALGYGKNIKVDPEDWSAGYLKVANEKGITKNLRGEKGLASTRGDVAVMTYNGINLNIPG